LEKYAMSHSLECSTSRNSRDNKQQEICVKKDLGIF
jgi:hypothetical protein